MSQAKSATLGQIQRLLEKQQFKQALKDARVAHRQAPSDESRRLLQNCALARAAELQRNGLPAESQKVLDELFSLQPVPPEIREPLSDLLIRLGLYEQFAAKLGLPNTEISMDRVCALADVAVLTGRVGTASLAEGSTAIRRCLDSLEKGELDQIIQPLDSIPRSSPFADWKLFVRGLAAYYRGDDAAMKANWERLAPDRKAVRIARRLRHLAETVAAASRSEQADKDVFLVDQLARNGVLSHLDNVRKVLNDGDHRRAVDALRPCLVLLGNCAAKLRDRVLELVTQKAIRSSSRDLMEQLIRAAPGPAFDPQWNRGWALFYEVDQESAFETLERHWRRYFDDIPQIKIWSPTEHRFAQALVLCQIGRLYSTQEIDNLDDFIEDFIDEEELEDVDADFAQTAFRELKQQCRMRAVDCFSQAQAIAPEMIHVWKYPIVAAKLWNDEEAQIQARKKLLERFPENVESLTSTGQILLENERPEEALPLFEQALRLKPLDQSLREKVVHSQMAIARLCALQKRFDDARARLDAVEKLDPSEARRLELLVRRSVIARKMGDMTLARSFDQEACALRTEPTYVLLSLLVQANRYELPQGAIRQYETDWTTSLEKKCSAQAAGEMAELLLVQLNSRTHYKTLAAHAGLVADYVGRATRVKFERQHLRRVCEFLLIADEKLDLRQDLMKHLKKLATRGTKLFPDDPFFPKYLADVEASDVSKWGSHRKQRTLLTRALDLAQAKPDLAPVELVNEIRENLEELDHAFGSGFDHFPFRFPRF